MTAPHACPWCRCQPTKQPARININTRAPFWPLVVEVDRLLYTNYRGRPR